MFRVAFIDALKTKLIPLATIITPNLPEAYALVGKARNFVELGKELLQLGPKAVLLKGGHLNDIASNDLFLDQQGIFQYLESKRIESNNTHGTGCTLAAALCAFIAQGLSLFEACKKAKDYLFKAILAAKENSVGKGHGPVHHFYHLWPIMDKTIRA